MNYKKELENILLKNNLVNKVIEPGKIDDNIWKDLVLPNNQESLNELYNDLSEHDLRSIFPEIYNMGYEIIKRPCKKYERLIMKNTKDLPKFNPYFKLNSDFNAFKIPVLYSDIDEIFNIMLKKLLNISEFIYIDQKENDIIRRLYFYSSKYFNTIVEVIIGHNFALEVFKWNSLQRDYPDLYNEPKYFAKMENGKTIYNIIKGMIMNNEPNNEIKKELSKYVNIIPKYIFIEKI